MLCQRTNDSTQAPQNQTDAEKTELKKQISEASETRTKLISALERAQTEVTESRKYVDDLELQITAKQQTLDLSIKKNKLQQNEIFAANLEIGNLRAALEQNKLSLKARAEQVDVLEKQLKKIEGRYKRQKIFNRFLLVGLAAAVLKVAL